MMTGGSTRGPRESGTVSIEFAIIGGAVLVFFFSLLIVAGRVIQSENDVRSAAQAAARAASLRDTEADAAEEARRVALENLSASGVSCEGGGSVQMIAANTVFEPGGRVTIEVQCNASVLPNVGLRGTVPFDYQATEVIDEFRSES